MLTLVPSLAVMTRRSSMAVSVERVVQVEPTLVSAFTCHF